jgi:hypothetical protein
MNKYNGGFAMYEVKKLSDTKLKKLQKLETELGAVIIAYENSGLTVKSNPEAKNASTQNNPDKEAERCCCPGRAEQD